MAELGYQVIAVSPYRPEKVRAVEEKSSYDYRLLSDTELAAALALGVAFTVDARTVERYKGYGIDLEDASGEAHHMLPVPAVFVLDTSGRIRYVYANPDYKGGQILLMIQVIVGYLLLGALVTRFSVLFAAGGPAGRFARRYKAKTDTTDSRDHEPSETA